jgi:putative ABC transport system permease protein
MFAKHLTFTLRNLRRRPLITFIMLFGLTISLASAFLIGLYVCYDFRHDDFHAYADNIYRVHEERFVNGESQYKTATTYAPIAAQLAAENPDVLDATRMYRTGGIVTIAKVVKTDSMMLAKDSVGNLVFRLNGYPAAKKVMLAGNFNGWKPDNISLVSNGKSGKAREWSYTMKNIPRGTYQYKFVVDGEWMTDPENVSSVSDGKGNLNSEISLGVQKPKITLQAAQFKEEDIFYTDASFLQIFSFQMIHGNRNDALSKPNTVVLTESTARKYFGKENPLGKFLDYQRDQLWEVTGVIQDPPANSRVRYNLLISFATIEALDPEIRSNWYRYSYQTYLLLKPNANLGGVVASIGKLCERGTGDALRRAGAKEVFTLQALRSLEITPNTKTEPLTNGDVVWALSLVALLLVLIAYINYINLTTARFSERAKNMGIRKVMGASRGELLKEFFIEPLLLTALALVLALGLVEILLPVLSSFTHRSLSLGGAGAGFWAIALGGVVLASVLAGLYPALVFSSTNPTLALKGSIREGFGLYSFRKVLVVGQFVISIALISTAFVMNRQLQFAIDKDLGLDIAQTLILQGPAYTNRNYPEQVQAFKNSVQQFPEVLAVTASTTIPGSATNVFGGGQIKRLNDNDPTHTYSYNVAGVDFDYLTSYGAHFIAGRNFRADEYSPETQNVVVNETALKLLGFRTAKEAIGEQLTFPWTKTAKIVGVMRDFHQTSLHERIQPLIFTYYVGSDYISVKLHQTPAGAVSVRSAIEKIKAEYERVFAGASFEFRFLDEFFQEQYTKDREFAALLNACTILTVIIACLGLIGLAAFTAEQRTKEIGIRKVLGASVASIIALLTKDFLKLVVLAIILATPLGYWAARQWLQDYAYRIELSWWMFAVAGCVAVVIALVTVGGQAWRAAEANPVQSLRSE